METLCLWEWLNNSAEEERNAFPQCTKDYFFSFFSPQYTDNMMDE